MISGFTTPAAMTTLTDLFDGGSLSGLTEAQLLERFLDRRDERAFELIVSRHASMVLGVCRRVLRDPHDVDDAFQATFLILVRNAPTIRAKDRLSPWLYGVAFKVATRARSMASSRRRREGGSGLDEIAETPRPDPGADLAALLDEELSRLPEKYRAPVVLCGLEGQTHAEAAARLGWPVGTVRSRLFRGRERLRERLTRRGVSSLLAIPERLTDILPGNTPAGASLIETTARLGNAGALKTAASTSAAALTQGVLTTMFMTKLKLATGLVLAATAFGSGAVLLAQQPSRDQPARPQTGVTDDPKTFATTVDRITKPDDRDVDRPTPSAELLARLELAKAKFAASERLNQKNKGIISPDEPQIGRGELGLIQAQINDAVDDLNDGLALLRLKAERIRSRATELGRAQAEKIKALALVQKLHERQAVSDQTLSNAESEARECEARMADTQFESREVELRVEQLKRKLLRLKSELAPFREHGGLGP